ncbi:nonstructural protein [Blackfly microvirus SF02]|uniref:Nonstructural protein n=1 Tax=Blackfly microvirus SF02 TaxID=2576452 RepID=A0A4P8PKW2_9VIRU|nr:nonstructural protein [Blackfly microvirus SF02]
MMLDIFAVLDKKANAFGNPFTAPNLSTGIRSFKYAANDKTTEIGRFPEDFSLYHLGSFDTQTAKIDLMIEPFLLTPAQPLVEVI